jgi:chemotaxis protein CheD
MIEYGTQLPSIYLKPNEVYIVEKPALVQAVLGSCVSVTMHSRRAGVGIMSHCLLPRCNNSRSCSGTCSMEFKYVDCSIGRMIEIIFSRDIRPHDIEVKMFGGADMFTVWKSISVGRQNIETALEIIRSRGLRLSSSDVGGTQGRKIFFNSYTGEVFLKRLNNRQITDVRGF